MPLWKKSDDKVSSESNTNSTGTFIVRPWYRQFYLRRGDAEWRSDQITQAGYERGAEEIDGFVYVGTTMYGSPTRLTVQVHATDPGAPSDTDRAEVITINGSGDLAVLNWEPGEPAVAAIPVPTGPLCARLCWYGIDAAAAHPDNDTGGDEVSPESLTIDIWPST